MSGKAVSAGSDWLGAPKSPAYEAILAWCRATQWFRGQQILPCMRSGVGPAGCAPCRVIDNARWNGAPIAQGQTWDDVYQALIALGATP